MVAFLLLLYYSISILKIHLHQECNMLLTSCAPECCPVTMEQTFETPMETPFDFLIILVINTMLALVAYLFIRLYRFCSSAQRRRREQQGSDRPSLAARRDRFIDYTAVKMLSLAIESFHNLLLSVDWQRVLEGIIREATEVGMIIKRCYRCIFLRKRRALEFELKLECRRKRMQEEESLRRKEEEQLRALKDYARGIDMFHVPGDWARA